MRDSRARKSNKSRARKAQVAKKQRNVKVKPSLAGSKGGHSTMPNRKATRGAAAVAPRPSGRKQNERSAHQKEDHGFSDEQLRQVGELLTWQIESSRSTFVLEEPRQRPPKAP